MNKRVVILWLCLFVRAVSLMAQDVPAGMVTAFKKGESPELNGDLSDKGKMNMENRSINVDRRNAEGKEGAVFSRNTVNGFKGNH